MISIAHKSRLIRLLIPSFILQTIIFPLPSRGFLIFFLLWVQSHQFLCLNDWNARILTAAAPKTTWKKSYPSMPHQSYSSLFPSLLSNSLICVFSHPNSYCSRMSLFFSHHYHSQRGSTFLPGLIWSRPKIRKFI
jgi:hypothetical protein